MKMKHAYIVEIDTTPEECEKMYEIDKMLFNIQDAVGYDDEIFFESVDSGECFDYEDLGRVRGILDALQNHRAWKIRRKGD